MAQHALYRPKKLAKAAYLALKYEEAAPWPLLRWAIVEDTGWTLEYVDALDMNDIIERGEILTARAKAREKHGK